MIYSQGDYKTPTRTFTYSIHSPKKKNLGGASILLGPGLNVSGEEEEELGTDLPSNYLQGGRGCRTCIGHLDSSLFYPALSWAKNSCPVNAFWLRVSQQRS